MAGVNLIELANDRGLFRVEGMEGGAEEGHFTHAVVILRADVF